MTSQLLGLAPELRNMVYELAFTTNSSEPVDLCTAASPSTALLSTCHQIYNEALQLYHEARNSYWSETHFLIEKDIRDPRSNDKKCIEKHPAQALQRIRHLEITAHSRRQCSNLIPTVSGKAQQSTQYQKVANPLANAGLRGGAR